jgi:diguanylate cyclase (GGDEF)-like protein
MLNLHRYFTIIGFVIVILVTVFFGIFYRTFAINNLKTLAEGKNVEHARLLSNSLWAQFSALTDSVTGLDPAELRDHPEMISLRRAVVHQMEGLPIVTITLYNLNGLTIFSTEADQIGLDKSTVPGFVSAQSGKVVSELIRRNPVRSQGSTSKSYDLLSSFVPVSTGGTTGPIEAIFELSCDVTRLYQNILVTERFAIIGANSLLAVLFLVLLVSMRRTEKSLKQSQHKVKQLNEDLEETVTARTKQLEMANDRLEYQTLHDSLTKLPNRTLLLERLEQAIVIAQREKSPLAVMIMDLDHFRDINDTMGHHNGDLLLKHVGTRLREALRDSDTVARLGGDEYAVLLPAVKDSQAAIMMVRKIQKLVEETAVISGQSLEVGASIGIVLYPEDGEDPDILMRRAEVAMYMAKRNRSGFAFYSVEQDQYSLNRLTLMGELRHAIENEELILHYQPKVSFESGRTVGVEALVRWQHPQQGLRFPDTFIPFAEQTGLIKPLTSWARNAALRECEAWHHMGFGLSVAVNISAGNLQDPEFPDRAGKLLKAYSISPAMLEFEITESAIMVKPQRAIEAMMRLSAMGVRITIDDFGTGYSSLAYLKKLPVSNIKIDKSFVMNMLANDNDAVIVQSTIELSHNLGLKVIAEGVETQTVWERLKELGCDAAQGYLISRPIPAPQLLQWMNESPWGLGKKQDVSRS